MILGKDYTTDEIKEIIDGEVLNFSSNCSINNLSLNSKSIFNNSNTVFFAIKGKKYDAHDFIGEVISKGVKNIIVDKNIGNSWKDINVIKVKSVMRALQEFASYHRERFNFKCIGITGSNGKTIVKEWLSIIFQERYNIVKSPKSYNSQIGVPLSVLQIEEKNDLGIFEAGISTTDEMENLEKMILPEIGILTNIGSAHSQGFKNEEEKIREKLKLFKNSKILIYKYSDSVKCEIDKLEGIKTFSFGEEKNNYLQINEVKKFENSSQIKVKILDEDFSFSIPFTYDSHIENSVICFLTAKILGLDESEIIGKMNNLETINMRMERIEGLNNCSIINDAYNSDLESVKYSLEFLEKEDKNKVLIISDVVSANQNDYNNICNYINNSSLDRVYLVGDKITKFRNRIRKKTFLFGDTDMFLSLVSLKQFKDEVILLKGSRNFKFEDISDFLQNKNHKTYLEVNLGNIVYNYEYLKAKLSNSTKIVAMVKANAYGLGIKEISNTLQNIGVDYLGVAYTDEGIYLRRNGIFKPIMVMNPNVDDFQKIIKYDLEPVIYDLNSLQNFIDIIKKDTHKKGYKIHLEFDTGMHRLGFYREEIGEIIHMLNKNKEWIKLESVFSHLAESENMDDMEFTKKQMIEFDLIIKKLEDELEYEFLSHILNSAGVSNYTKNQLNMVRIGLSLYGISYNGEDAKNLKKVASLKTIISQIKKIKKGDSVSYNRTFVAEKDMKIAVIPIGYSDGFSRHFSNKSEIIKINDNKLDILGNVCMDTTMVDITDINFNKEDKVIIFDFDSGMIDIAKKINTIPYEIISSISQRIKRVYLYED